jgi:polyhydroxyalkanoic acid synthase PhaR subunit
MTTQAPTLPTWKDLYDQAEAFWTKPIQTWLATDTAVASMSFTREQVLNQTAASRQTMEAYWEALRLPSKTDHARLAGQVVALEAKVEGLEDRLDTIIGQLETLLARKEAKSQK